MSTAPPDTAATDAAPPDTAASAESAESGPSGSSGSSASRAAPPRTPRRPWRLRQAGVRAPRPASLPGWWPLALCVLLGMAGGAAYGLLKAPQYTATSYVAVVPGKDADPTAALGFAQAYGRIATTGAVLAGARTEADAPVSALQGDVQAVTSPDAPLIEITSTAARAGRAADISNAVADSLTRVANKTAKRTEVKLTVFAAARAPSAPSSPSTLLSVAVGGCTGVLCGGLLLLVRPSPRGARHVPEPLPAPGPVHDTAVARQVQRRVPVKDLRKGASRTAERP